MKKCHRIFTDTGEELSYSKNNADENIDTRRSDGVFQASR